MTQREILEYLQNELVPENVRKAAMTSASFDSGGLGKEAADRFIDLVVDESVLLKSIRVHRTDKAAGDISKMTISGPVTQKATEGSTFTGTRKPTNGSISYATKKTVSAIDLTGEVESDTIEGAGAKNTIMGCMVKQIANDMETLAIEGDTSITGVTDIELLLKTNDGFLVQTDLADSAHIVDATGHKASMKLLKAMLRAMPTKYRRDLTKLRWIMSSNVALDLQDELAQLGVAVAGGLADTMKTNSGLPNLLGVAPLIVPLLPEDLTIDGTAGDTGSFIWLSDPQNFIYVVQRELTVEWLRVPRADTDEGTVHMRTDFLVQDTDAVVRADNVNADEDADKYGHTA